ncbi:MAG: serine protease [Victivallaceae bacterium]|nr:serine protease [Victivallaceae bacterium]
MFDIRKTACFISIVLSIVSLAAHGKSKKKEIDPATAMVSISSRNGKAIGFITQYGKRRVIVTSALAVFDNEDITVTDSNKRRLKTKVYYFAKDRDLAILYIKGRSIKTLPFLPLEGNASELKTDGKVKTFGKLGEQQIKTLDKTSIVLSNSIEKVAFGTPVISEETGNVIGVVVRMTDDSDMAKDKISLTPIGKCIARLDNISKKQLIRRGSSSYGRDLRHYQKLRDINEWGDVVMQALSDKYLGGIDISKKLPKNLVWKNRNGIKSLNIPLRYKIMNDIVKQLESTRYKDGYNSDNAGNYTPTINSIYLLDITKKYISFSASSLRKRNSDYYVIEQASRALLAHNDMLCKKIKVIQSIIAHNDMLKRKGKPRVSKLGKIKRIKASYDRR